MEKTKLANVILVTSDEKSRNYKWEEKSKLIKGIQVVSEESELDALKQNITFIGLQKGIEQVFVKDPFHIDIYVEITKAEDRIFKNKIKFYKKIALLLGAKSFSAKAEFIEENKFTMEGDVKVSHPVVEVDLALRKEQEAKFNKIYTADSALKPYENFDRQRAFEDAQKLVKELNFENEIDIVSLIENNDPSLQSREVSQNITLELTSELNDLLEMSFNLTAMGGVFNLSSKFKSTTESVKKIILNTEIIF